MRALFKAAAVLALLLAAWSSRKPQGDASPLAGPFIRSAIKHPWLTSAAVGGVVAIGAFFLVVSGIVSIKASSGHWPITARFLDFAKVRSVATHALGIKPPPLDDPALELRGAGHYESGCYPCHGGPGVDIPPVMAAMTPVPPHLTGRIARWKPSELFSIVKHGIKLTGMPAWPAQQRDDEVWAMVAFLRRMPTLDATGYRMLVYGGPRPGSESVWSLTPEGQPPPPRAVRDICWRCHGADGTGRGPGAFPSFAGQRAAYVEASLRAFAKRERFSGIMSAIAASLEEETVREVSDYYSRLPARSADVPANPSAVARGEAIAARGLPDLDIPSCADCHGPSETPKNPAYPILASQHARYLALQFELFKEQRRGGSGYQNLMHVFAGRVGQDEIRDVTLYYASLNAASSNSAAVLSAR